MALAWADFLLGVEAEQRRQRAEGFLPGHAHLLGHAGQDGRLEKLAAQGMVTLYEPYVLLAKRVCEAAPGDAPKRPFSSTAAPKRSKTP